MAQHSGVAGTGHTLCNFDRTATRWGFEGGLQGTTFNRLRTVWIPLLHWCLRSHLEHNTNLQCTLVHRAHSLTWRRLIHCRTVCDHYYVRPRGWLAAPLHDACAQGQQRGLTSALSQRWRS
jgi:hypothetical protein